MPSAAPSADRGAAPRPAIPVLLVDDDEVDRLAVRRALDRSDAQIDLEEAPDGDRALDILAARAERGDGLPLVLLDLNMPGLSGLEVLDRLRSTPATRAVVVFVFSTSANENDLRRCYERNVAGYIVKDELGVDLSRLVELLACYGSLVRLPG